MCNPLRFAPNYAVLAAACTCLAALARPLDHLLVCGAVALALFAGGSQRAFDAAWPYLHRWAVFDVMGAPLRVDGVCVKLNGRNVGNEQTLWGLPRLVWGFASAALAALLVARNPVVRAPLAAPLSARWAFFAPRSCAHAAPSFATTRSRWRASRSARCRAAERSSWRTRCSSRCPSSAVRPPHAPISASMRMVLM